MINRFQIIFSVLITSTNKRIHSKLFYQDTVAAECIIDNANHTAPLSIAGDTTYIDLAAEVGRLHAGVLFRIGRNAGKPRMFWFVAGLFVLGAVCGAAIRMMVFVIVLLCAATIAIASSLGQGLGAILLDALITIVALQIGYAAGLILRSGVRRRRARSPVSLDRPEPVRTRLGEKRH